MCGRFTISDPARIAAHFSRFVFPADWNPSYNVAPTHRVPAVCNDTVPNVDLLHWGLLPAWATDKALAYKTINARCETVAEKPLFRSAFRRRRCVVFADSWFEWVADGKKKRPFRFVIGDNEPIAFAGLWEVRAEPDGTQLRSCSIITTQPNELQATVHDRAPVLLNDETLDLWLTDDDVPAELLLSLCKPSSAARLSVYEVSPLVNNVRNDRPECIRPITSNDAPSLVFPGFE